MRFSACSGSFSTDVVNALRRRAVASELKPDIRSFLFGTRGRCTNCLGIYHSMLLFPNERQGLAQLFELQPWRLAAVEDHLNDVRSEQVESQHVPYVRCVDVFLPGNFLDGAVGAAIEKLSPAEAASERLYQDVIHIEPRRCG